MGHLSRDSYFSRGIPLICARDRSFSSAELCHNQTDPLPKRGQKAGLPKNPALSEWGIDKNLACYTAPWCSSSKNGRGPVIVLWIRNFALGVFGLFPAVGFVPIAAGALIANAVGRHSLSEGILVFGFGGWIAIRTWAGWRMSVEWRKSEDQRIKEGRESTSDILRREEREKKKLRRKEYVREAMRLRAEAKQSKNDKSSA